MNPAEIHFDKAPIVEAVIGIDFEETLPIEVLDGLRALASTFAHDYPTVEPMVMAEYKLQPGVPVTQIETPMGFFFRSADGLQVVHAKRTGFAFSRLAPYRNWHEFISEAKHTWGAYRGSVGPSSLGKFTVRYINRLSWPSGAPIEDYLAVYPHIPEGLPQTLGGCFLRLDYPLSTPYQGKLIQQIATVPEGDRAMVSFVLDNEFSFSAIGLSDLEVWDRVNTCRTVKNDIFLKSISDKMRGLIS